MLIIKAGPVKQTIVDLRGKKFNVYKAIIHDKNGEVRNFQNYTDFADLKDIEIIVQRGCFVRRLDINLSIRQGIINFLNKYHTKQDISFDCYSFVNMTCGVKQHKKIYLRSFWKIKFCGCRLNVGDAIFFVNKKSNYFYHAAIYIGFGLYISVYGAGGSLEISTLKDMKKDFGAELVLKAMPRE